MDKIYSSSKGSPKGSKTHALTTNQHIKEYMAKMPYTITTKKECDEYYKAGWKEIKEEQKTEKAATKNAESKKRIKKVEVDDDGNEIEKVKKPLNGYQQFIREYRSKVMDENPGLSTGEYFRLIATKWQKEKNSYQQ